MKSKIADIRRIIQFFTDIAALLERDRVSVYAAQASFFIIISSIPFIMLLISLSRFIIPVSAMDVLDTIAALLPKNLRETLYAMTDDIFQRSALPLISVTAVTTLWSASRGVAAVGRGIQNVYGIDEKKGFFYEIFRSLFYTVTFIALILVTLVILVFGQSLMILSENYFPALSEIMAVIINTRGILFFVVITLFFTMIYSTFSKGQITLKGKKRISHIPGAAFAAAGWMLYSFFYSLYIQYFPSASYIYGGLAAVVLLMLWLYFCMTILLYGAELNKLIEKKYNSIKSSNIRY